MNEILKELEKLVQLVEDALEDDRIQLREALKILAEVLVLVKLISPIILRESEATKSA